MAQLTLSIKSEDTIRKWEQAAKKDKRSLDEMIHKAVEEYIDRLEWEEKMRTDKSCKLK